MCFPSTHVNTVIRNAVKNRRQFPCNSWSLQMYVVQREYVSHEPVDFWYPDCMASRPKNRPNPRTFVTFRNTTFWRWVVSIRPAASMVDKPLLTVNCITTINSYSAYLKAAISHRKLRARPALVTENSLTCRLSEVSLQYRWRWWLSQCSN